jgi:hypothetical protein
LHVWILVKNTVALDAILALPDCCEEAVFSALPVTVANAALLAFADICDVASLMENRVALSASEALLLTLATGNAVLETSAADDALPDRLDVAVFSAPDVTVALAAILAFADICDVASLITSFVTLSASDALLLTFATAKAVLEASAADDALPDRLDVAVLLPSVAPCAAIRELDCICEDASLATFAVAALLAFDANRAFTVTVLVTSAALLTLPVI